jgi:hypothetical protein
MLLTACEPSACICLQQNVLPIAAHRATGFWCHCRSHLQFLLQVLLHCSTQAAGLAVIATAPRAAPAAAARLLLLTGYRCCVAPAGKPASVLAGPARQTTNNKKAPELQCAQLIPPVMKDASDDSQLSHRILGPMLSRQQLSRAPSPRVASPAGCS